MPRTDTRLTAGGEAASGHQLAHRVGYDPALPTEWDNVPGTVKDALDELRPFAMDQVFEDFFNGTIRETFDALITSDGTVVTLTVSNADSGNLTLQFSSGTPIFTAPATIDSTGDLTLGADFSNPVTNYVYILQSTLALTVSTSGWPTAEHAKIGVVELPDATTVQNQGAYINQNINDHLMDGNSLGHLAHICLRLRRLGAIYVSGIDPTLTIDSVPSPDTVNLAYSEGVVSQMHPHTLAAFDTESGGEILLVNHNTDAFTMVSDLADALTDASGGSLSGKYYTIVIWAVANKSGEYAPVMCNLPTGSYNTEAQARADAGEHTVYTIPPQYLVHTTTGFLLTEFMLRHQTAGSGTFTLVRQRDLRSESPSSAGSGNTPTTFSDANFGVYNAADTSKLIAFLASAIASGTTRTIAMPDQDINLDPETGDLALLGDPSPQLGGNLDVNNKLILNAASGSVFVRLADTSGATVFAVLDSDLVPQITLDSNGNIVLLGTVDGRDVNSDGTKLDTIATNANAYTHPDHTGDVTSSGDGVTAIADEAVTNAKLAHMAQSTIKGRAAGAGTGDATDLSVAQVLTILGLTHILKDCHIFYKEDPGSSDDFPMWCAPSDLTVTKVIGFTDTGTVDFNLEERTTPAGGGVDIIDSGGPADPDLRADADGESTTTFSNAGVDAEDWIAVTSSGSASSPTKLWVAMFYTIDA